MSDTPEAIINALRQICGDELPEAKESLATAYFTSGMLRDECDEDRRKRLNEGFAEVLQRGETSRLQSRWLLAASLVWTLLSVIENDPDRLEKCFRETLIELVMYLQDVGVNPDTVSNMILVNERIDSHKKVLICLGNVRFYAQKRHSATAREWLAKIRSAVPDGSWDDLIHIAENKIAATSI